jgi:signal transduction histidine kinase
MTDLVSRYSKLEAEKKSEQVDLKALIQAIVDENRLRIEETGVSLQLDIPDDFMCKFYYGHAYSLLNNLMLNALDALEEVPERRVDVIARHEGEQLRIEFSDSGAGIPAENIDKIFDAFFSTKPRTGTGLGLAMSKKIVELYDGSIRVNSSLDKGTKFTILLPSP